MTMIKIQNKSGCCKYCKKADTCILSAIFPLLEKMGYKNNSMRSDIYEAVEKVLYDKYHIYCTANEDCCPYCIKHRDSACYGDPDGRFKEGGQK